MTGKRCPDCKHTKGIGYDFWCGEGHTEYEVFGAETNCPYYEYHDWSKGVPSRTAKRFTLFDDGETIFDNETVAEDGGKQIYWVVEYGQRVKVVELLNELHEENIVLKQEVELLRSGLESYEDNLPVYLTCKEVNDFHSDIYEFKIKQQSFYKEHPNRCKIFVNGVELK